MENKFIILGCGTPNACFDCMGPSNLLIINNHLYLIDAGAGVVRQVSKLYNQGFKCCNPKNIETLFLTHLHSDHTTGMADVMLTPWVLERDKPLTIYGPKGTQQMCENITKAYNIDIQFRLHGFEKANSNGYKYTAYLTHPGVIYKDKNVTVSALNADHGLESYAYKFEFNGKKVVISGDTAPLDTMIDFAKDADILVHEVYYAAGLSQREAKWQIYHQHVHTSSLALAHIASISKPKLLVTTHRIYHMDLYNDNIDVLKERKRREQLILQEIQSKYNGHVVNGHDLDIFDL